MILLGILFGFGAALSQSIAYIISRWYRDRHDCSSFDLLVLSHVMIGMIGALILPWIWPAFPVTWHNLYGPSLACSFFYFIAQGCLFLALRRCDASRTTPLMGMKVVFLALITALWLGADYNLLQWIAIGMSLGAALLLGKLGGAMPLSSIGLVLLACLLFSFSDLNVKLIVDRLGDLSKFHASILGATMVYAFCGGVCLFLLPWFLPRERTMWRDAVPFTGVWVLSILALFLCFAYIGVVYGNIVQATRGILSILLGALVAGWGMTTVETELERGVLLRRVLAAALMVGGIALFYLGESAAPSPESIQAKPLTVGTEMPR